MIDETETVIHNLLRTKAIGLGGTVFAVNGSTDHVHMVASIPPAIAVAKFVGQVKGVSSTRFNQSELSQQRFYWQDEYGAFSFDRKRLPNFIAYVERQKQHHIDETTIAVLERTDRPQPKQPDEIREPVGLYLVEEDAWRLELEETAVE